ncbi:putative iron-regulated membrane protein [Bradyrhizobium sp. USDA 4524]|uniref:PepSY domain-containing protein n=1 Tax=unclassified Bradyrhizobium TaxID=2631580 RepID=UPI0020A213C9|nr:MULTISPECIES: PepSY domain-containing protein [unclassified Bradyrhizobium]MCP1841384.1 putative iron-regulated membrane protein [Bradyrhizobium sp. USDA 4538]MCP1901948.1 putative iron-regulated membrane protein [Bradyrhizobium sp. USDA 4537]MCP1992395.1 putative iron-regulated membrane protein [Bradyrhizobium sp. USDA 4539]
MRNALIRRGRRWLYIVHRWIGIATCLLFAMWFISGLVMMYVAFPRLTDSERLAALPVIPWSKVQLAPDRAMAIAGVERYPRDLRLSMMDDTPVYRVTGWKAGAITISATDGSVIDRITPDQALAIAAHHPHAVRPRLIETITRDQWSVTARFDPLRPLHLIDLGDADGTEFYVSSRSGEIALDTTRCERIWNWLGSIPHWIYPTVLRKDGPLWRDVVLWISGVCLVVAITGFWIGVLRLRLMRRYADGAVSPYRGWMAWHHIAGLIGGICVLTWMFSGWLSLNPGGAFSARGITREITIGYSGHETPDIVAGFQSSPSMPAVEARFVWIGGHRLMLLDDGNGGRSIADPVTGARMTLSRDEIIAAARHAMPGAAMTSARQLDEPDAYWYTLHQTRELPVLRIGFDDPAHTWLHISPVTGEILDRSDDSRRSYRWLFNALHSLDFPLLLRIWPARDVVVWLLSAAGTIISISGIVIGWRRLRRRKVRGRRVSASLVRTPP